MRISLDISGDVGSEWAPAGESEVRVSKKQRKVTVLLSEGEHQRFEAYCTDRGFKKSTLIVRLIREHLLREGFTTQEELFPE